MARICITIEISFSFVMNLGDKENFMVFFIIMMTKLEEGSSEWPLFLSPLLIFS
jgi:hypothetical protein